MEATSSSYSSASNNDGIHIRPLFLAMPWLNADGSSLPASNAGLIASKSKAEGDRNEEDGNDKDGGGGGGEEEEDYYDDEDNDCDDDDDDEEEEVSSALVAISVGLAHCREVLERGSVGSLLEEEDKNRAEGGSETPPCVSLLPDRHSLVGRVCKASSATTNCSHFVGSRASGSTSKEVVDHSISDSAQVVWTDDKHDLYLNLMEANFVRNMYNHGYCYLDLCGKQPQQHIESTEESLQSHENNSTSSDVRSFLNRGHSNWLDITASRVDKEVCTHNDLHLIRDSSLDVKKKRGYASNCEERPRKMSMPTSKSSFRSSFSDQVVPYPGVDGVERIGSN